MAAAPWAARGMSILPGLQPRPQHFIMEKQNLTEEIQSNHPAMFVYLKKVETSQFVVKGKVGKITLEDCCNVIITIEQRVVSGVLELIRCKDTTIKFDVEAEIPTIQVDDSQSINIHIKSKPQLERLYFIRTTNLQLFLEDQTIENENGLTLNFNIPTPENMMDTQQMGHWSSPNIDSVFIAEPVVRDGVFPTTAQMKKAAEEKEEAALLRMADMLAQGITITKPGQIGAIPRNVNKPVNENPQTTNEPTTRYGRESEDEKREYFDDAESLESKLDTLAEWIKESKHCIFFTGAGISTSCGIPDFRSGMSTVLPTGPGAWELKDKGKTRDKKKTVKQVLKAVPSLTHMGLVSLHEAGYVKFVISQNVDGLHLRSGLNPSKLAELHGNTNLEKCMKCKKKYLRDFRTRTSKRVHDHTTGRLCDDLKCRGKLKDSIVNFGENLPTKDLNNAYEHAKKADLCICMGSSLTVSPANEMPEIVAKQHQRLVICNLQQTPLHGQSTMNIHAMCDNIMKGLLTKLELPLTTWKLIRRIRVTSTQNTTGFELKVIGLDVHRDLSYSLFKQIVFKTKESETKLTKEPFVIPNLKASAEISIEMMFHGHYSEPPCNMTLKLQKTTFNKEYLLEYNLQERTWEVK